MNNQKIKCKVKACKYNSQGCNCDLDSITVVPESDCPTAHFCGDYCKKENY
ncbi:unknown [Subdoligranulum sp. CAG:314]|nr:unknown [Subdoligranulum sp. CAG:314]